MSVLISERINRVRYTDHVTCTIYGLAFMSHLGRERVKSRFLRGQHVNTYKQ